MQNSLTYPIFLIFLMSHTIQAVLLQNHSNSPFGTPSDLYQTQHIASQCHRHPHRVQKPLQPNRLPLWPPIRMPLELNLNANGKRPMDEIMEPRRPLDIEGLLMEGNKNFHRMQTEDSLKETQPMQDKKRNKTAHDAETANKYQQDNTPMTKLEKLVQLHRVEPMLETSELQVAVRVVEMQAQMQISATAGHANPMRRADTGSQQVKIAIPPVHPAKPKHAQTAQEVQAVIATPAQPAQPRHAHTLQRQQQMQVLDSVQPAGQRRAQTADYAHHQARIAQPHAAMQGIRLLDPVQPAGQKRAQTADYAYHQARIAQPHAAMQGIRATPVQAAQNTPPTNTAEELQDHGKTAAEEQAGQQAMSESVQTASMQDAWSDDDDESILSTGQSPMEIDPKMSPKMASNTNSIFIPHKVEQNPTLIKRAEAQNANVPPTLNGHINFRQLFQVTKAQSIQQQLYTVEYYCSATTGMTVDQLVFLSRMGSVRNEFEKLTLGMELLQAKLGGPSHCDSLIRLADFGSTDAVSDMFLTIDGNVLGMGGTAKVYRGNSEYLGRCVAIKEVDLTQLSHDDELAQQYRKEVAILHLLAQMNAKYSIRIFKSEDINNELSMVMELGVMDLRSLWMLYKDHFYEKYKEFEMAIKNGTMKVQELAIKHPTYWGDRIHLLEFIKHLYTEMIRAVAEFHQIGMHLDLKLDNFLAVLDQNGTLINMPKGQIRVTTKLIDFGGANLINPDRYRVDLPMEIRQKMIIDTTACIRHNVQFGTAHYISPEQVKSCNGFYMVSTKADIWTMGTVLYEMLKGDAPYAILCHKAHPIRDLPKYEGHDDEMRKRREEEKRQRRRQYSACLSEMAKNPESVDRIEYPRNAEMDQDGTKHLWNIVKASLQYDPRLRPTAKGILAYLRRECRLQINRMGDLMGYHKDVPWKRCELEPKEGEVISRDPDRFNTY